MNIVNTQIMQYPLISEYVDAIRSAEDNLDKLIDLRPVFDSNGTPIMSSGNFAVVFKMRSARDDKLYALKCFTKEQEGREEAYRQIADELEFVQSTYLAKVRYYDHELFVDTQGSDNSEFPVLLMDWVEGETLDRYVCRNINDTYVWLDCTKCWHTTSADLPCGCCRNLSPTATLSRTTSLCKQTAR